ncbi:MAG: RNA 2',3'-cyclic phosphodiesterase [Halobacteriales archaeon]
MRLFVSVDLPEDLAEAIASVQELLADAEGIRPVEPTQAHVTLKFLDDTTEARVPEVVGGLEGAVADAGVGPFEVELAGLGVFPSLEYISVVWVGVDEGADELRTLHEAVERALVDRGFEPESHDFTPHVTIARMDHAGGKALVQRTVRERSPSVGRFAATSVNLTESTLTPDGPRYETVERVPLGS